MNPRLIFPAALLSLGLAVPSLHATQTDNFGIHAVPVPGKVVIDGSLDDWDHSGEILICYDLETLRDVYSAKVSAMYDADNLYVAIRWKDPIPMGNRHDPKFEASKAWAGDCVQLRIKTDRISHVTTWFYAPNNEPAIDITYGKGLEKPFGGGEISLRQIEGAKLSEGAEMSFRKDADGKGYVQEIKLPWKLITADKKYVAGESFNLGVDLLWGEADWPVHRYADNVTTATADRIFFFQGVKNWGPIVLEPKGNLKLPEPAYEAVVRKSLEGEPQLGPVEIVYELPKDAKVTLAIDDASGKRIRNLTAALPRKAGRNMEKWDGLDDEGKAVAPGEYAFKVVYHDGIHANYVMSFACPGMPTWETVDGTGGFYGNHSAPEAAAAGGEFAALACPIGEGAKHLIGVNLDGKKIWGLNNREFNQGGKISLATDGKILWVANEAKGTTIYRVDLATGKYAPWKTKDGSMLVDLPVSALENDNKHGVAESNLAAIAQAGGRLAVSFKLENRVAIFDAETGAVIKEFPIPAPTALTRLGDVWLVLSAGELLRLADDGKITPFSNQTFADGYGLTADAEGFVYLSVRGADQNVKVFSPEGSIVREIGKRGGRPLNGKYDPLAMRDPAQIALDSRGNLWVTESTRNPKRTSVWNAKTGELVRDLAGTTNYAGAGALDPFDPTIAYSDDTIYQINLAGGTSAPVYSLARREDPADLFPPRAESLSRVVKKGDDTLIYTAGQGSLMRVLLGRKGDWKSAAVVGFVPLEPKNNPRSIDFSKEPFVKHPGEFFSWADQNGDGLVQESELQFAPIMVDGVAAVKTSSYWGEMPDVNGTLPCLIKGGNAMLKFPVKSLTASGAPVYDVANPEIIRPTQKAIGGNGMVSGGGEGRVYINQSPLTSVGKDGTVLGTYPSHHVSVHGSHTAVAAKPGFLIGPSSFLGVADLGGEVGEIFYLNGNLGENYIFTSDAMWVQSMFKDVRGLFEIPEKAVRGMPMDGTTAGGESFGGNFVRTPDGKTYLTIGGADVIEITGLDSIKRLAGKVSLTKEQYVVAQQQLRDKEAAVNQPKVFRATRSSAPGMLDGSPAEWPELLDEGKALLEIQDSPQKRFARVSARYDAENFYVAWRVLGPRTEMKNSGQDFRLLFKTGDVVDLMLGPDPQKQKGEGNLRLVIAPLGGQLTAVLNQQIAPGAAKGESFEFASPWRSYKFDRVVQAADVKIAQGKTTGGYFVEAAIPWKLLGITPKPGLKLKADFGVLFGDSGGNQTMARHYWSNQATGNVNDIPDEAALEARFWGTLELE